jgi:hypothetical protein
LTIASDSTRPEDDVSGYGPKMTRRALVQAAAIDATQPPAADDRRGDSNGEQLGDDGKFSCSNRSPGTGYGGATAARPTLDGGWRRWLIDEVGAEEGGGGGEKNQGKERCQWGEKILVDKNILRQVGAAAWHLGAANGPGE